MPYTMRQPPHPYIIGLLHSLPENGATSRYLQPIGSAPPALTDIPPGCRFAPRCPLVTNACRTWNTELLPVGPGHDVRCWRHDPT